MSEIIKRISFALAKHLRADEQDDFRLAARDAIAEVRDAFNIPPNSSLNYAADELQAELDEDAADFFTL